MYMHINTVSEDFSTYVPICDCFGVICIFFDFKTFCEKSSCDQ